MAHIHVIVQLGPYPSPDDVQIVVPINPVRQEVLEIIDEPKVTSGCYCTPTSDVRRVKTLREAVANEVARAVSTALAARDQVDGSKKA